MFTTHLQRLGCLAFGLQFQLLEVPTTATATATATASRSKPDPKQIQRSTGPSKQPEPQVDIVGYCWRENHHIIAILDTSTKACRLCGRL